jgi:hypothetical protein
VGEEMEYFSRFVMMLKNEKIKGNMVEKRLKRDMAIHKSQPHMSW